jgi:diguanylate cyclase (GGDEF)-like protein
MHTDAVGGAPHAHVAVEHAGRSRRGGWTLLACAILVLGLAGSVAAAGLWRSSVRTHERQTQAATASDVSSTLATLLSRDADFVATLRGVLTMRPHMSDSDFNRWFAVLQGPQRLIGGLGAIVVEPVPSAELSSFQARRDGDPAFRTFVGGAPETVAPASSGQDCLLTASVSALDALTPAAAHMVQGNWCSRSSPVGASQAPLLQAATESGQILVLPVSSDGVDTTLFQAAFYRDGAGVANVAQRRAAVAGWIVTSVDIRTLVQLAVAHHPDLGLSLFHSNPGHRPQLIDRFGDPARTGALSQTRAIDVDGEWTATVSAGAPVGAMSASAQGLLVLVAGAIVSALACALLLVLSRSRERALGMVEQKTGELRHQALHDALTGLPNRVLALDRAQQMLARARRQRSPVAALYVDVDGFKDINDTFGHAAGDELLRIVAERLGTLVREGDTAARLGGDEFVVLLEGSTLDAGPELVADRLLEVLRQPYELGGAAGRPLKVTASIGVAMGIRESADELLRDADLAMYRAKQAGRNRSAVFESSMQTSSRDRVTLEMDLADALERRQFFLVYQPTFDLRSRRTIGVEALIRWRHPTRGVLGPVEFIAIAEASSMIVPIGRWVLEEACRQTAVWHARGHAIGVSVNVSARQLDDDELVANVRRALQAGGLDASSLTLEITETVIMRDAEAAAGRLRQLKELGVRIAIDDFGVGYSSLAYLRQLPADSLKIDRSFIAGVATSSASAALIRTLVQLGRSLQIETLAEGIEDQAQLETLRRENCEQGQGFLFSRPLEVDALEEFLNAAGAADVADATAAGRTTARPLAAG